MIHAHMYTFVADVQFEIVHECDDVYATADVF